MGCQKQCAGDAGAQERLSTRAMLLPHKVLPCRAGTLCTRLWLAKMCHALRSDAMCAQVPGGLSVSNNPFGATAPRQPGLPKTAHAATLQAVVKRSSARRTHCGLLRAGGYPPAARQPCEHGLPKMCAPAACAGQPLVCIILCAELKAALTGAALHDGGGCCHNQK